MPENYEAGGLPFGTYLCRIGAYNYSAGTWGTLSRIFSTEMGRVMAQVVSAVGRGDMTINAAAAILEGAELTLRFTGMNRATLAMLTGKNVGNISDYYNVQLAGGDVLPYLGLALKTIGHDGSGAWVWLPQIKIMQNFMVFEANYGTFNSPELTIQCISEPSYGIVNVISHAVPWNIPSFPPANIAAIA